MADIHTWDILADNNTQTPPDGAPEGILSGSFNDVMREYQAAIRRHQVDNDGSLVSSGPANTFSVDPVSTYAAYFDGLTMRFEAHQTNTGAATFTLFPLAAAAIQTADGQPLRGSEIRQGGKYRVIFNASANAFQLTAPSLPQELTIESTGVQVTGFSAVDLSDADAPFRVGLGTGTHIAFDGNDIQAKTGPTTAGPLSINTRGGAVTLGEALTASSSGVVALQNSRTVVTGAEQNVLRLRNNADGGPAVGSPQEVAVQFESSVGVALGRMGFEGITDFLISSFNNGGNVALQAANNAGAVQDLFVGDPDGAAQMFFEGIAKIQTQDESATGSITGGQVIQRDGVGFVDIAPAILQQFTVVNNFTLDETHAHRVLRLDGSGAPHTITFPNSSTSPPLYSWGIIINNSASNGTLARGTGVSMTSQAATNANVTLANRESALWWHGQTANRYWILRLT